MQLLNGEHKIELECMHCYSDSVQRDQFDRSLTCVACGRATPIDIAHRRRRDRMMIYIQRGVDLPHEKRIRKDRR